MDLKKISFREIIRLLQFNLIENHFHCSHIEPKTRQIIKNMIYSSEEVRNNTFKSNILVFNINVISNE